VFIEEKNLSVLALHMGIREDLQNKQIEKIVVFVEEQEDAGRKVVVMGDFNFDGEVFNLSASNSEATVPDVDEIKLFEFEAWDNIFYKGFELKKSGVLSGLSDHKIVWADFEL